MARTQNKSNALDLTSHKAQYWLNPNEARTPRPHRRVRLPSRIQPRRPDAAALPACPPAAAQVIKTNGYGFDLADAQSICLDGCPSVRPRRVR